MGLCWAVSLVWGQREQLNLWEPASFHLSQPSKKEGPTLVPSHVGGAPGNHAAAFTHMLVVTGPREWRTGGWRPRSGVWGRRGGWVCLWKTVTGDVVAPLPVSALWQSGKWRREPAETPRSTKCTPAHTRPDWGGPHAGYRQLVRGGVQPAVWCHSSVRRYPPGKVRKGVLELGITAYDRM